MMELGAALGDQEVGLLMVVAGIALGLCAIGLIAHGIRLYLR